MLKIISYIFCFMVVVSEIYSKKSLDDETIFSTAHTVTLALQHAFGVNDTFRPRGSILIKTGRHGTGTASLYEKFVLDSEDIDKFTLLVKENGLYFIRAPTKINGDTHNPTDGYVSTYVKACFLVGSGLREQISVAIDNDGNVLGLGLVSPSGYCATSINEDIVRSFNSSVYLQQQVTGAVPDTQSFVRKIEQEKAERAAGKGTDSKSFIAKYWMYILPVFLILMLSSQAEQQTEGGGE